MMSPKYNDLNDFNANLAAAVAKLDALASHVDAGNTNLDMWLQQLININLPNIVTALGPLVDIANIAPAIQALDLVCSPDVTLVCGGTYGGTQPPSDPGIEGGTPPQGFEQPPTTTYNRKCRVANAVHENFVEWMTLWKVYNVDTYAGSALVIPLITLLGALAGELITPVPLIDAVGGAIVGFYAAVAIAIIEGGFDLDNLLVLMNTHEEELVCALYNSTDAESGREAYLQILEDNGAGTANMALLRTVLLIEFLNLLYFKKSGNDFIEAKLDNYTPTVDCTGCGGCIEEFTFETDLDGFTTYSQQGSGAVQWSSSQRMRLYASSSSSEIIVRQPVSTGSGTLSYSVEVVTGPVTFHATIYYSDSTEDYIGGSGGLGVGQYTYSGASNPAKTIAYIGFRAAIGSFTAFDVYIDNVCIS